ncbi:hypothetical protein GCM10023321_41000 [Pseudonocardia eucalypti]|uniref:Bulb-type lectin domain-containing protein n=1 Tax=Pseudonocardia eucalypti TaxID=648755 RepID=A0ABP9QCI4_9PSEU
MGVVLVAAWTCGMSPAASVAAAPSGPGVLASGASLAPDQSLRSRNGQYQLIQQTDGNLVLYRAPHAVVWSSQTTGEGNRTVMRADGLVR